LKTGNPSACATMKWKVFKSSIALYYLYLIVSKRVCVIKVLINRIIRTRTRHSRHAYHPTHDNMHACFKSFSDSAEIISLSRLNEQNFVVQKHFVGSEVFTAVVIKSSSYIFRHITLCIPLNGR
jgi:hypothetical protein